MIMRLLYFIPLLSTVGGQERTLVDKANYLVDKGHDVMFMTYEHEGLLAYKIDSRIMHVDINCHFFSLYKHPIYRRFFDALKLKYQFRTKLKNILKQFRPDVIVVTIPNTENFICDLFAVAKDIPVVVESHLAKGYQVVNRGITEKWLYLFYNPLNAIRKAKLLIALTKGDADCWKNLKVGQIKIIPNPLTYYPVCLPSVKKLENRIICVGRLTPQKRFDRLMDAFSLIAYKYPLWQIDIFGEGELKEKLLHYIDELGMQKRIRIMPSTQEIYSEYQLSQFLVLCSDFEGFGMVIVEAMACGIPVVATDCPYGPSEIIEDGKTGLLAKMDARNLAEKMEWMMTHEKDRKVMGLNAYHAAARYQKEVIIPQWEECYRSVIV